MQPHTRPTTTAMGAAFAQAGVKPEDIAFDRAISLYLNNGGTIARAYARLDLAAEKLPEGHSAFAHGGLQPTADRQPYLPEDGQPSRAGDGHSKIATSRETSLLGEGHVERAEGQWQHADSQQPQADGRDHRYLANGPLSNVPPVRDPSAGQVAAMAKARAEAAKSIFDRAKTSTGRAWGNVCYRELDQLANDGVLAAGIKARIGGVRGNDRHKTVREFLSPLEFHALLRKYDMVPHEH